MYIITEHGVLFVSILHTTTCVAAHAYKQTHIALISSIKFTYQVIIQALMQPGLMYNVV